MANQPQAKCVLCIFAVLVIASGIISGCVDAAGGAASGGAPRLSTPTVSPSTPTSEAEEVERVDLQILQQNLIEDSVSGAKVVVQLLLPDTCTVAQYQFTESDGRIDIALWGERPRGQFCAQVIREEVVQIALPSYSGSERVRVNGVDAMPKTESQMERPVYERGPVFVETLEVRSDEANPSHMWVDIQGMLPDACAELIPEPRVTVEGRQVFIELSWQRPQGLLCAQVLRPFATTVDLGELEPGDYVLTVNDFVNEFTVSSS